LICCLEYGIDAQNPVPYAKARHETSLRQVATGVQAKILFVNICTFVPESKKSEAQFTFSS
jgi:hypothetical protein